MQAACFSPFVMFLSTSCFLNTMLSRVSALPQKQGTALNSLLSEVLGRSVTNSISDDLLPFISALEFVTF